MYTFFKHSGRQFKVEEGDVIVVDKITSDIGSEIEISDILMSVKDNDQIILKPEGKITCEVLEHYLGEKVMVIKHKAKKGYRRKKGHRQAHTKLKIKSIVLN